ncbi:hypothetical protein BC943DRAFT_200920 [Umbelopsis sp. AD052]|nr:hypothetical protein BC943DRAFT_200920 [Umbelopsis sp. AD052]
MDDSCPPVIQSFFPNAVTLGRYLSRFPECSQNLTFAPNGSRLRVLLESAMVADIPIPNHAEKPLHHSNKTLLLPQTKNAITYPASISQEQLVHESIFDLLSNACSGLSHKNHLLAKGFRMITGGAQSSLHGLSRPVPIEQAHTNTLVAELKGACWKELLTMVGPAIMRQLLLYTCIFIKLQNSSFYQITGIMIHELGVKPGPVQVPHYIPNWVENIHAGVGRAECCRDNTETKRKIPLDAATSKSKRCRKLKSSRNPKKNDETGKTLVTGLLLDIEQATVKESLSETEYRPCRRQRKRKRLSLAEESERNVDLLITNALPGHGTENLGADCNIGSTKGIHNAPNRSHQGKAPSKHTTEPLRTSKPSNSSILLKRSTIYYQNPIVDKQDKVYMCLPKNYMLNMPIDNFGNKRKKPDENNHLNNQVLSSMIRPLLVDIFPKQFGRPNVFDGTQKGLIKTSKWTHSGQWKTSRRQTIIPPRLHDMNNHFEAICRRHSHCQYRNLLDRFCPLKAKLIV